MNGLIMFIGNLVFYGILSNIIIYAVEYVIKKHKQVKYSKKENCKKPKQSKSAYSKTEIGFIKDSEV